MMFPCLHANLVAMFDEEAGDMIVRVGNKWLLRSPWTGSFDETSSGSN